MKKRYFYMFKDENIVLPSKEVFAINDGVAIEEILAIALLQKKAIACIYDYKWEAIVIG